MFLLLEYIAESVIIIQSYLFEQAGCIGLLLIVVFLFCSRLNCLQRLCLSSVTHAHNVFIAFDAMIYQHQSSCIVLLMIH